MAQSWEQEGNLDAIAQMLWKENNGEDLEDKKETQEFAPENPNARKYELLTENTKEVDGHTLYQIRAVEDFTTKVDGRESVIKAGTLGGYVEKEDNLSKNGGAWVADNAVVYGDAKVRDDAYVFGNATVKDNAIVEGHARVGADATIKDSAQIGEHARVNVPDNMIGNFEVRSAAMFVQNPANYKEAAVVGGNARVTGEAVISSVAEVGDNASIRDRARVTDHAKVMDNAQIAGRADIKEDAQIKNEAFVGEKAIISGHAVVKDSAYVAGDARVKDEATVGGMTELRDSTFWKVDNIRMSGAEHLGKETDTTRQIYKNDAQVTGAQMGEAIRDSKFGQSVMAAANGAGAFFKNLTNGIPTSKMNHDDRVAAAEALSEGVVSSGASASKDEFGK